ncbi:NAD(P)/FAD-dependent oxidoreductase [Camelimonas abortus]|uniref:NAD(P)/FAD-dependent oxidoreductase n=1 Tax=Camelimonas abortus TaxID=1017184 RepID=A0ABV7LGX4_9HYPH
MSGQVINTGVAIIGAGHAGGAAAAALRQAGYAGPVLLAGEEPHPPYQRPPLSKAWLKGEIDHSGLALKHDDWYGANAVDLRLGVRALAIDPAAKTVTLDDGATVVWEKLVIATGARPRLLPGMENRPANLITLRNRADADALKAALAPGRRLVIIGAGYVGLEVAASATGASAQVTVLEREPRVLARVASPEMSAFFSRLHRGHGVDLRTGARIAGFDTEGGRITAVRLEGGETLPCDAVLAGVGAVPNAEIAEAAGLACDNGVIVDGAARTSHPDIFAIGDVTHRPLPLYGRTARLESVPSALEQAKQAACAIAGKPQPPAETPWFWSDQYDVKLQIAGLPFDADRRVARGDPDSGRFAVFHLAGGRLMAVEAANAPQEFMAAKMMIQNRRTVDPALLADPGVSMKEIMARQTAAA